MDYVTEQNFRIVMERQEPTFYARLPKIATVELTPYELALYCNYKQTAGEGGGAWKSNNTLAKECQMSPSMIQRCRKSLEAKGYIQCQYDSDETGNVNQSVIVTIVDVWDKNHDAFYVPPSTEYTPPLVQSTPPLVQSTPPLVQSTPKEESFKKRKALKDSGGEKTPKITDADKLAQAFGLVPSSKQDWALFGKLSRELQAAGIAPEQFPDYVKFIRKQAKETGDWTVTPNSLIANARPSLFISAQEKKAAPTPPAKSSWGYVPDTRSEAEILAEMEREK